MYATCARCKNCKKSSIHVSDSQETTEATCPYCGSQLQLQFDLQVNGYWRGLCPKCHRHIATYVLQKGEQELGFCGECLDLFQLKDGQTFERRDKDGHDVSSPDDKKREQEWMERQWSV